MSTNTRVNFYLFLECSNCFSEDQIIYLEQFYLIAKKSPQESRGLIKIGQIGQITE